MKLTDILPEGAIIVRFEGNSKEMVFSAMISAMEASGKINDAKETLRVVLEREQIMSTGIGKGFALPHGKTNAVTETIGAFLTLKTPMDFQALDNQPVSCVFMLIGRENNVGTHLRLLSKISRMMNNDNFRLAIQKAASSEEIISLLNSQETQI